jgi:hypothetical protein
MEQLERDAQRICLRFRLRLRLLEAERANVKRRYGVCFSDGTIRVRLRHATTGKPLKYSSLVNTLCHELAHLRHFNHGPRFQTFYAEVLEWARRERIYCPGPSPGGNAPRLDAAAPGSLIVAHAVAPARADVPTRSSPKRRVKGRERPAVPAQLELFG